MVDQAEAPALSGPPQRIKLSDRWFAKLGIRLFGFDRLVHWYLSSKRLHARTRATLHGQSRAALRQRSELIQALSTNATASGTAAGNGARNLKPSVEPSTLLRHGDLKIAVFIPGFHTGKGGAEKVAGRVAATLARAGNEVHLYCRAPDTGVPAYNADHTVEVRHLHERDDRQVEALRAENYDLIVGFAMRGFYLRIAAIARMLGVPFVIQECNNPRYIALNLRGAHLCRDDDETHWLRQAVCSHAAGVRLTVPHYAESVERDVSPFTYAFYNSFALPEETSKTPKKKFIAVGALKNPNKNGLAAVRAFCAFATTNPGWSLHLYGENKYGDGLRAILDEFQCDSVFDHGVVHDVDEIYGDAYALLIPSFHEGLPNVVIEAFSYGVPCIGYADCEGTNQLIRDGENGFLLDRSAPNALADAIARIADPDLRNRLGANARRFAEQNLRLEQWEENWLRLAECAANGLNRSGEMQKPAAHGASAEAALWQALLDTYLHFGEHADGKPVRFERDIKT